jgi:hypothetical protein
MRVLSLSLAVFAAAALAPMQAPSPKSVRLADISWLDAEPALAADAVVVIPLGYLTRRVMERTPASVLTWLSRMENGSCAASPILEERPCQPTKGSARWS